MKTPFSSIFVLLTLLLFSQHASSQTFSLTTDFEKTEQKNTQTIEFKKMNPGTKFRLDSTCAVSGKYCLSVKHPRADSSGETFNLILPKQLLSGLRALKIIVKIREEGSTWPTAGLWCKAYKENKMMGWASTMKGQLPPPLGKALGASRQNYPLTPWMWSDYTIDFIVNNDPDEVIIGGFALYSAWFDDIHVFINGNEVNDLVIPVLIEETKK